MESRFIQVDESRSAQTCNQLPTRGRARGPGGSFILGARRSFMTIKLTTTVTNNPCTTLAKLNKLGKRSIIIVTGGGTAATTLSITSVSAFTSWIHSTKPTIIITMATLNSIAPQKSIKLPPIKTKEHKFASARGKWENQPSKNVDCSDSWNLWPMRLRSRS